MTTASSGLRWERLGAVSGIAFFLAILVSILFGVDVPDAGAEAQEIRDWYGGDQTGYLWITTVVVLGLGALIWFSASLRTMIRRVEPDGRMASLAFAGGILTALMFLVGFGVEAQSFFETEALAALDDAALSAFHSGGAVFVGGVVGLTTLTRAVMLLAVALAAFRFAAQPRWLAWVTAVVAALSWLGILALPLRDVGGFIWFLAFLLFPIWVLIASIELVMRLGRMMGAQPATAPSTHDLG